MIKDIVDYFRRVSFTLISLTDSDEDVLGPEGMEKFCEDIGVEPENVSTVAIPCSNVACASELF